MKPEVHDKSEFLRETAKELLEDGQPHSYGEIVKFIRGRAEGTNWEGQVEVNNVWHVLDDLVKTTDAPYGKVRRGVYQKNAPSVLPPLIQTQAISLYDILDQAVDLLEKLEQYHHAAQNDPDPAMNSEMQNTIYASTFQEFDRGVDWLTYWLAEIENQHQKEDEQNAVNEIGKDMSMSM